ncbi:hypothetical protein SAMN05421874_12385 [Nonomuraea maritima]|uniref:Uncharacterized protein n=1 Tax=Nonomuraea maritima TaxID=683260 RepID=A0A1G9KWD6_9ACTN|nr:DUF6300 family protein [Nonomuraea maritima]SDL53939.1 hypothetical protein SAMN05421874_12385 [Nonomuraea maritima]
MTGRRIEIVSGPEPPRCPRCRREGLLLARVPYGWTNAGGVAVRGRGEVVLCAACDADAARAAPLITWFHVHATVEPADSEEFLQLLAAWADEVSVPPLDRKRWEDEIEQLT